MLKTKVVVLVMLFNNELSAFFEKQIFSPEIKDLESFKCAY